MGLNLKKHTGPMDGARAKSLILNTIASMYVVTVTWPVSTILTNNGAFLHGFILDSDIVSEIAVWKEA